MLDLNLGKLVCKTDKKKYIRQFQAGFLGFIKGINYFDLVSYRIGPINNQIS